MPWTYIAGSYWTDFYSRTTSDLKQSKRMQNQPNIQQQGAGVLIRCGNSEDAATAQRSFIERTEALGIARLLESIIEDRGQSVRFRWRPDAARRHVPDFDTLHLCDKLQLQPLNSSEDMEKEIILSALLSPAGFEYPSYAEFYAAVRIRRNIAEAARRTALSFHTSKIERPTDYWTYTEGCGFTLLPGKSLVEALRMATQPDVSGQRYSFSCYRASEYVIVLGIAQELARSNPALLEQLQRHWESRAIMSRQFHDVFLREYGSMSEPLPARYYVPGDRLWFRNPDERSSDVEGYEGSWVIYLGGGLFSNFWKNEQPYTLTEKCVEIYHWREGIYRDAVGRLQMDETIVEEHTRATMNDPAEVARVLERMMRLRDPSGVYADGGCIDTSRESPRWVCPGTADMILPDA